MRRYWEWLGLNLGKRAGTVGVVGLLVTVALGFGITTLHFTTSNADYLNKTDPAYVDNLRYAGDFGGDPMATVFTMKPGTTIDDLFTPTNQRLFRSLDSRLKQDHWVYSEISPLDALSLSSSLLSSPTGNPFDTAAGQDLGHTLGEDPKPSGIAAREKYLGASLDALKKIPLDQQQLSNPAWVKFLAHETTGSIRIPLQAVLPNNGHALFAIFLQPNLNINQESAAAQTVLDIMGSAHFQNATTITTGVPAVLKVINSYLRGGILVLGGIAAAVMTLILLLTFRVRWRLLPFVIVAIGLVWGFGLVGYFGVPLTLATIAALPVLMGVGMDYAIQMHSRIEEEVVLDRAPHPVQSAARGLGPALLVVTLDAVFAFAGMWFAKVPDVRKLGSLLIIGIVAVCVCSIIATLAVLGIREYKSPTKAKDFSKGFLSRLTVRLGSLSPKVAVPAAFLALLVFFAGIAVEGKLQLQTNPIQWLNPNSQAIKNVVQLKNDSGSDQQLGALVTTTQPWSQKTVDWVSTMSRSLLAKYPNVLYQPTGAVNTLDEILTVPGSDFVEPTGTEVAQTYAKLSPAIQRTMATDGGHDLNILFRVRVDTLSSLVPVVNTLEHEHPPPGITVAPGGISIVGVGLLQNLAAARTLLTYLALLFVGVWLAVRLRSIVRSLLSLVPVLIAVGAVSLLAVAFNIKLSPLTAVAGPLVVAVCTEFTSLMLLRFIEERNRGYPPRQAMEVTASRTGRAFMVSGMTAFAGVAVVATSPMPLLGDFGIIVALNVGVALLSALVILPPILVWADDDKRQWVSRGMLRPIPEPIEFATAAAYPTPARAFTPEPVSVMQGAPSGAPVPEPVLVSSSAWQSAPPPTVGWTPEPVTIETPTTKRRPWGKVAVVPVPEPVSAAMPVAPAPLRLPDLAPPMPAVAAVGPAEAAPLSVAGAPAPLFVAGAPAAAAPPPSSPPLAGPPPVEPPVAAQLGPDAVRAEEPKVKRRFWSRAPEPVLADGPAPVQAWLQMDQAKTANGAAPVPVPALAPEPVQVPAPMPTPMPEPVQVQAPMPMPEPVQVTPPMPMPEPVQVHAPEPVQVHAPEPVQVHAPEPVQVHAPEPVQVHAPEPVQVHAPEPVQVHAPEPVQVHAPEPVQVHAPEPVQVHAPEPVQAQISPPQAAPVPMPPPPSAGRVDMPAPLSAPVPTAAAPMPVAPVPTAAPPMPVPAVPVPMAAPPITPAPMPTAAPPQSPRVEMPPPQSAPVEMAPPPTVAPPSIREAPVLPVPELVSMDQLGPVANGSDKPRRFRRAPDKTLEIGPEPVTMDQLAPVENGSAKARRFRHAPDKVPAPAAASLPEPELIATTASLSVGPVGPTAVTRAEPTGVIPAVPAAPRAKRASAPRGQRTGDRMRAAERLVRKVDRDQPVYVPDGLALLLAPLNGQDGGNEAGTNGSVASEETPEKA